MWLVYQEKNSDGWPIEKRIQIKDRETEMFLGLKVDKEILEKFKKDLEII